MTDPHVPHMTNIPRDCVQSILQCLDCSSTLALASTCRHLYEVVCQCPMVDPTHVQPIDFTEKGVTGLSTWNTPLLQAQVFPRLRYIVTDVHELPSRYSLDDTCLLESASRMMDDILSDTAPLRLWFEISDVSSIRSKCLRTLLNTAPKMPTPWLDQIEAVHLFDQTIDSLVLLETLAWIPSITFTKCDFAIQDLTTLASRHRLHTLCINTLCFRQWDKTDSHPDSRKITLPFAKTLKYPVYRFEYVPDTNTSCTEHVPCTNASCIHKGTDINCQAKVDVLENCHLMFPYPGQTQEPKGLTVCASSWAQMLITVQGILFLFCVDEGDLEFAGPIYCSELRVSGWYRLLLTEAPNLRILRLHNCDLTFKAPYILHDLRELYLSNSCIPRMWDGVTFQTMALLEILELAFDSDTVTEFVLSDMPCLHTLRLQVPNIPFQITDNPCLEHLDLYESTHVTLLAGNPHLRHVRVYLVWEHHSEEERRIITSQHDYLQRLGITITYWRRSFNLGEQIYQGMKTFSTRQHWPRLQNTKDNVEEIPYTDVSTMMS